LNLAAAFRPGRKMAEFPMLSQKQEEYEDPQEWRKKRFHEEGRNQ